MQTIAEQRAAFNEAYAPLNPAQKQAVDTIEGPVMVIAGPGTGKTQILTLRIANILLSTDTAPESILALTFTEAGAINMRQRLRRFIGSDAYRVSIHTFHGLAAELINYYPDAFPALVGGTVATDLNKIDVLNTVLQSGDLKLLRPVGNPTYYVKPLLHMLSELKREYVLPDTLATIITRQEQQLLETEQLHIKGAHKGKVRSEYSKLEKTIAKNHELLFVYRQFEALKSERNLFDFDDMITEMIAALSQHKDMLRDLQERYQYVLADEHQDVNGAQNKILELLVNYHEQPNIFVVGDEKQAIYRFQGASLENFLYFEDKFPGTKTISLTENYRSGQVILDAAHSLIGVAEGPLKDLRVPLTAAAVTDAKITLANYPHQAIEHDDLVSKVATAIEHGTSPEEIAVIVRTNREVEQLTNQLRTAGIAVNPSADSDILEHPITVQIEQLIKLVTHPTDEAAWFTVLHGSYWDFKRTALLELLSKRSYQTPLASLVETHPAAAVVNAAATRALSESPQRVLAFILEESGFIAKVLEVNPIEGPRVIRRLYDEIEALVGQGVVTTLADVSALLTSYRQHQIALSAPFIGGQAEAVNVLTAHKAKGLEFELVFVPHCTDSSWGVRARRQNFIVPYTKHTHEEYEPLDDERRLFYVAMTRAKHTLVLSYAAADHTGTDMIVSRLIDELDSTTYETADTTSAEESFNPLGAVAAIPHQLTIDFIQQILKERGFSATSLNNYLKSPWDWLYRNVLRIPEVQPLHMLYGTAVHSVLQQVVKMEATVSASKLKAFIDEALGRLPVSTEEFAQLHQKALETLSVYVPHLSRTKSATQKTEMKFRVVFPTGLAEIPELPLTGMLDRLDFDETGKLLRVVDYKTGKPKTRNAIEGKTKNDDGGYKRQLVFYSLLLSLYDDERYQTNEFVLSFVEPDAKGIIHEEVFSVTKEEIEALRAEIISCVQAIIAGAWLQQLPEKGESEYAAYARLLLGVK